MTSATAAWTTTPTTNLDCDIVNGAADYEETDYDSGNGDVDHNPDYDVGNCGVGYNNLPAVRQDKANYDGGNLDHNRDYDIGNGESSSNRDYDIGDDGVDFDKEDYDYGEAFYTLLYMAAAKTTPHHAKGLEQAYGGGSLHNCPGIEKLGRLPLFWRMESEFG